MANESQTIVLNSSWKTQWSIKVWETEMKSQSMQEKLKGSRGVYWRQTTTHLRAHHMESLPNASLGIWEKWGETTALAQYRVWLDVYSSFMLWSSWFMPLLPVLTMGPETSYIWRLSLSANKTIYFFAQLKPQHAQRVWLFIVLFVVWL